MQPTQKQPTGACTTRAASMPDTPAQVLRDAALYLQRHGWTQGLYFEPVDGTDFPLACAMGAVRMAVFGATGHPTDSVGHDHPDAVLINRTYRQLAGHLDPVGALVDDFDYFATDRIGDWND